MKNYPGIMPKVTKFNGEPCSKCGSTVRYILGRNCVNCMQKNKAKKRGK